jgi:hypothetical protein
MAANGGIPWSGCVRRRERGAQSPRHYLENSGYTAEAANSKRRGTKYSGYSGRVGMYTAARPRGIASAGFLLRARRRSARALCQAPI